jgi:hypothetical protein
MFFFVPFLGLYCSNLFWSGCDVAFVVFIPSLRGRPLGREGLGWDGVGEDVAKHGLFVVYPGFDKFLLT